MVYYKTSTVWYGVYEYYNSFSALRELAAGVLKIEHIAKTFRALDRTI